MTFKFIYGNLNIGDDTTTNSKIKIKTTGNNGNIEFNSTNGTIFVNSLPTTISATHLNSNITISRPTSIKRKYIENSQFHLYVVYLLNWY